VKIHAYKVDTQDGSAPLEDVLALVEQQADLRERIRLIRNSEVRVEAVEKRDDVWFMDFVRIRMDHGPGRVSRDAEVEGFDLDDDEGFGEETAALFDPGTGYILIQYNHSGVRAASIADYLCAFNEVANNLYTFKPKYDENVERKLLKQGITRKLAFTLDVSKLSAQDRLRGAALSDAINYGRGSGADKIKIEISVGGDRNRGLADTVKGAITSLRNIMGLNPEAVTKLEVTGKEDRDALTEVLDLIEQRLSVEISDLQVGPDRRYPRDARWSALLKARDGWRGMLSS
jgi:hypothetical protein